MKYLAPILLITIISGCDGHFRNLCLIEPGITKTIKVNNTKIIEVDSEETVHVIIILIVAEFQLQEADGVKKADGSDLQWGRDGFGLMVKQVGDGEWYFTLIDWPACIRSELSKNIEKRITAIAKIKADRKKFHE